MILRHMPTASLRNIFPIILLLPFALHARPEGWQSTASVQPAQKIAGEKICIKVNLGTVNSDYAEGELHFPAQDGKPINPSLPATATLAIPGATAIVNVVKINENAANIECKLKYMHTHKWARFFCCLSNKYVEESVTHNVTVDMNQETDLNFGNSTYLQYKKSAQVIPAGSEYLAGLKLHMCRSKD